MHGLLVPSPSLFSVLVSPLLPYHFLLVSLLFPLSSVPKTFLFPLSSLLVSPPPSPHSPYPSCALYHLGVPILRPLTISVYCFVVSTISLSFSRGVPSVASIICLGVPSVPSVILSCVPSPPPPPPPLPPCAPCYLCRCPCCYIIYHIVPTVLSSVPVPRRPSVPFIICPGALSVLYVISLRVPIGLLFVLMSCLSPSSVLVPFLFSMSSVFAFPLVCYLSWCPVSLHHLSWCPFCSLCHQSSRSHWSVICPDVLSLSIICPGALSVLYVISLRVPIGLLFVLMSCLSPSSVLVSS